MTPTGRGEGLMPRGSRLRTGERGHLSIVTIDKGSEQDVSSDPAKDDRTGSDWSDEGGATPEGPATDDETATDSDTDTDRTN